MSMSNSNNSPPWAGNVSEREDGTVSVGPEPAVDARQRAETAGNQMDRIEAKIDYLIVNMEGL